MQTNNELTAHVLLKTVEKTMIQLLKSFDPTKQFWSLPRNPQIILYIYISGGGLIIASMYFALVTLA